MIIYFLRVGAFIKIGYTIDLAQRIESLKAACPYEFEPLLTIRGDQKLAQRLHVLFDSAHHRNGFFHEHDLLRSFIELVKANKDVGAAINRVEALRRCADEIVVDVVKATTLPSRAATP